ncbi:MAG: hypothetical protein ACRDUV_26270 [Pseudonocardiaceae bacterium]
MVLLTALLAQEFGARPGAQVLATGCTAVSAFVIAVGHLLSTATFDRRRPGHRGAGPHRVDLPRSE